MLWRILAAVGGVSFVVTGFGILTDPTCGAVTWGREGSPRAAVLTATCWPSQALAPDGAWSQAAAGTTAFVGGAAVLLFAAWPLLRVIFTPSATSADAPVAVPRQDAPARSRNLPDGRVLHRPAVEERNGAVYYRVSLGAAPSVPWLRALGEAIGEGYGLGHRGVLPDGHGVLVRRDPTGGGPARSADDVLDGVLAANRAVGAPQSK